MRRRRRALAIALLLALMGAAAQKNQTAELSNQTVKPVNQTANQTSAAAAAAAAAAAPTLPEKLLITTPRTEKVLSKCVGTYSKDGDGRYTLDSDVVTRYLYRGSNGKWTITGSEENIVKNKGKLIASTASDSPIGVKFFDHHDRKVIERLPVFRNSSTNSRAPFPFSRVLS